MDGQSEGIDALASVPMQLLLDAFVAIASEHDPEAILEQAVDLARLTTQSRYGAAVTVGREGITCFVHQGLTRAHIDALPHPPEGRGMLGAVLAEKAPIRLDRLQADPRSVGFPLGHVPMEAFLGVPVMFDSELLGALYLTKPPGQGAFNDNHEMFMHCLARQTGQALKSASLLRHAHRINQELLEAIEMKRDFVAMASHELGNPVTTIVGLASLLRAPQRSAEDREEDLEILERSARRLMRVVEELLTISQMDAGVIEARVATVPLRAAMLFAVRDSQLGPDSVPVHCPSDLTVRADPQHLSQILGNFLDNARKYGRPPYTLEAKPHGAFVEIDMYDSGHGVPEHVRPKLFQRFARGAHDVKGTGLGLSIVDGLAKANGGEAFFQPRDSGGSCFGVRLRSGS